MKTNLFLWLLLLGSIGFSQQITLDTTLTSDEEGVIEQFWYWSGGFPVNGQGFAPNSEITVFATDPEGNPWRNFTGTSDANGNFSVQISAKKIRSVLGEHTVTATDGQNTITAALNVTANLSETLTVDINPSQISMFDFAESGITIKNSGFQPNEELKIHIFSPNESGSEIEPNTPKYADENGNFEMNVSLMTQSYPWGPFMPEVPGRWRISIQNWASSESHNGEQYFQIFPDNPTPNNYCTIEQVPNATNTNGVYPITLFEIVGVETNSSPVNSDVYYEDFTDKIFAVNAGDTYTIRMKGKNFSPFAADTYTMFIDWNQNGVLDEENEVIHDGYLFTSTGEDDKVTEFEITIPENAVAGSTRLRILKVNSATTYSMYWPNGACGFYTNSGQVEDYTLTINGGITLPECEMNCPEDIIAQAAQGEDSANVEYDLSFDCAPANGICEVNYPGNSTNSVNIVSGITASDFEIPSGSSGNLTQISANIVRAAFTAGANINIYKDNGGVPGELIKAFENVPYTSQTDAGTIGGFPVFNCVLDLPETVELESGKYWLGLNVGGPLISWETTDQITNSPIYTTFNNGSTWELMENHDGVFKVVYECTTDPSSETEIVLVDGLASGSEFPVGTTTVIHNLVYQGVVVDTCAFEVTVEEYMSVSDLNSDKIAYYPNPVKDILNIIDAKQISNVAIFDLSGKQVHTQNVNNKNVQINVAHLSVGVYIVKAQINGEVKTFKIVKK